MRGELDAARCAPPTARRPPAVVDVLLAQPNERARSTNLAAPDAAAAWAAPMAVGAGGPPGAWQSTATPTPLATSTWTSPNGIPYGGGSRRRALRARQRALAPTRVFPRPRNSGNPLLVPPVWRSGPRCVSRASRASRVRESCTGVVGAVGVCRSRRVSVPVGGPLPSCSDQGVNVAFSTAGMLPHAGGAGCGSYCGRWGGGVAVHTVGALLLRSVAAAAVRVGQLRTGLKCARFRGIGRLESAEDAAGCLRLLRSARRRVPHLRALARWRASDDWEVWVWKVRWLVGLLGGCAVKRAKRSGGLGGERGRRHRDANYSSCTRGWTPAPGPRRATRAGASGAQCSSAVLFVRQRERETLLGDRGALPSPLPAAAPLESRIDF